MSLGLLLFLWIATGLALLYWRDDRLSRHAKFSTQVARYYASLAVLCGLLFLACAALDAYLEERPRVVKERAI